MANLTDTQFIQVAQQNRIGAKEILQEVYKALEQKGYNPISQMVGYLMSGDPTYITSFNNARSMIMKVERDEILEELIKSYINTNLKLK